MTGSGSNCRLKPIIEKNIIILCTARSLEYIREKELTRPALPYDYTCFADGTPFEKESFNLLNVNFYFSIFNKTDFDTLKK